MLSFFPRDVLDEILNLIESVSEGFPSYSLRRDMDHLANRTAELRQGGKDWYVGWQSIPVNNCLLEKCEPVIVYKMGICLYERGCMYLDSLVLRMRYWDAEIATRSYVTLYSITRRLSMRLLSRGRQFGSFGIAVTLEW